MILNLYLYTIFKKKRMMGMSVIQKKRQEYVCMIIKLIGGLD